MERIKSPFVILALLTGFSASLAFLVRLFKPTVEQQAFGLSVFRRSLSSVGLSAKRMVLAHIFSAIIPAECAFPAFRRNLVLNCDDSHFATSGGSSSGAQNFTAP
jgi:hypothetical protein